MSDRSEVAPTEHRVNQRPGAATADGINYKKYFTLLVLLRLIENSEVLNFYIIQDVNKMKLFNHVAIRVTYIPAGENIAVTKVMFIQLQFKESRDMTITALASVKGKGDFRLERYFECYKEIINKDHKFGDSMLDGIPKNDLIFVIYTNSESEIKENNCCTKWICWKLIETVKDNSNVFQFRRTTEFEEFNNELKINNNSLLKDTDNFFDKLWIFAGQANTMELEINIKKTIQRHTKRDIRYLSSGFQNALGFVSGYRKGKSSFSSSAILDFDIEFQGHNFNFRHFMNFLKNKINATNLVVRYLCHNKFSEPLKIGKTLPKLYSYFIERELSHRFNTTNNIYEVPFLLLSADPGMGKSWYFTSEAQKMKEKYPHKWIIMENLTDYSAFFNKIEINKRDSEKITENFLMNIAGVSSNTFEFDLFQYYLTGTDMVLIYLDGVDEISPYYYSKVVTILDTIRRKYKVKLWVSTRPVIQRNLEEDMSVKSWTLREFNKEEIERLLHSCYGKERFTIEVDSFPLLKNPLFCSIIGNLIKRNIGRQKIHHLTTLLSETDFYDEVVDIMFIAYYKEKEKGDVNNSIAIRELMKFKEISLENHAIVSLMEVCGDDLLQKISSKINKSDVDLFLEEISTADEKLGFIIDVVNGKPKFLHRTFAEYFAALWFVRHKDIFCEVINNKIPLSEKIDVFVSYKLNCCNEFFKIILSGSTLEQIRSYVSLNNVDINSLDDFGRNALFYGKMCDNFDAFRCLLLDGFTLTDEIVATWLMNKTSYSYEVFFFILAKFLSECFIKHTDLIRFLYFGLNFSTIDFFNRLLCRKYPNNILEGIDDETMKLISSKSGSGLVPIEIAVYNEEEKSIEPALSRALFEEGTFILCPFQYTDLSVYHYPIEVQRGEFILGFQVSDPDYLLQMCPNNNFIEKVESSIKYGILQENFSEQKLMLHEAVKKNDLNLVKSVLEESKEDVHINCRDTNGRTALHIAVACRNRMIYIYLMEQTGIDYVADNFKLFPHDYELDCAEMKEFLIGFGYACYYLKHFVSTNEKMYGIHLKNLMKFTCSQEFLYGMFIKFSEGCPLHRTVLSGQHNVDEFMKFYSKKDRCGYTIVEYFRVAEFLEASGFKFK